MPTLERLNTEALRDTVRTFRDAVRAHAGGLNRLNVYPVPDGDTGTNMARTLDAVVAEMDGTDPDDLDATCDAISHGSLMGARGNSGVILSQIMRGIATTLKTQAPVTGAKFAEALQAAATGAYQAVLKPIEGTILTVVRLSADGAKEAADAGGSLVEVVRAAQAAGRIALENTPEQLAVLKDAGSGGAVAAAFDQPAQRSGSMKIGGADEVDVADQRYEVMYFMDLADEQINAFKQGWGAIGDSIVVVGGDGIWNCHVHTNDIGAAIEVPLDLGGRPKQIRVTDLFEEVDEEHAKREAAMTGDTTNASITKAGGGLPPVTTAVVAVCSGEGLVELFAQLRVQGVVTGGQTMNPSTSELLDTVAAVNADQVVILPNNKNIIPVAEQVNALSAKQVMVVPTTSMPEALAALVVYDPEASADINYAQMVEAAESVATGEVTQAIRDTSSDAGPIKEGDWIGIVKGDGIAAISDSPHSVSIALLEHLLDDDAELVTVIAGQDATAESTAAIEGWLSDHRADIAVEVQRGGQPLYPYLFGIE